MVFPWSIHYTAVRFKFSKHFGVCCSLLCYFRSFRSSPEDMFTEFRGTGWEGGRPGGWKRKRERERERERERINQILMLERNIGRLPPLFTLTQGLNPQPSYVPWPGIEPSAVGVQDDALANRATWPSLFCYFFSYLALYLRHSENKERTWRSDPHSILRSLAIRRAHRF